VHSGLFIKLMNRGVPKLFLDIIVTWYDGLFCRVRWGTTYSDWFEVTAGVRQGGVLSPDFYSIYVDELIEKLKKLNVGCYVLYMFIAAIFYADDMAILSPSLKGLQILLIVCQEYCTQWDICLNAKKSKVMYFGRPIGNLANPMLDCKPLQWVSEWKYLGVLVRSGKKFDCSVIDKISKFYKCANAIFRVDGRCDDMILLRLVEAHCVSVITYAIEIVDIGSDPAKNKLRVAYNSVFRRIFGYRQYESVRTLQSALFRPTWEELVEKRVSSFRKKIALSSSPLLGALKNC
jgi:hypothetical protein